MSLDESMRAVVVIGAGLAGLTAAFELRRQGIEPLVLDKEREIGASWARRHPQLALNTHRSLSALPGLAYPEGTPAFPRRDGVIAHLRSFAERHGFAIRHGVEVLALRREDGGFRVETSAGILRTRAVIVATGRDARPEMPLWPGLESYRGRVIHAADFGDARSYAGRSVLVAGGGNSGFDLLNHLSRVETGPLFLSLRRGPGLLPKRLGGFAVHRLSPLMTWLPARLADRVLGWTQRLAFGDLQALGFPPGPRDAATRLLRRQIAIAVDDGAIAAIRRGRIQVVAEVESLSATAVTLRDGTRLQPDVVIAALGYASALAPLLAPLGAIDADGRPRLRGALGATGVPGLWLVGMKPSLTSYFHQARREAKAAARAIRALPGA